jgi:Zn-dependent protease with chaperone function
MHVYGKIVIIDVFPMTSYRYPEEQGIFAITIILLLALALLTAGATLCLVPLVALVLIAISYWMTQANHKALLEQGIPVTPERTPQAAAMARECRHKLQPGPVDVIIAPSQQLNAYTFGLSKPQVIVLYSALFQVMDEDELSFILGHEMGHVALGHTWLNTLLGGMAGVPVSIGAALIITLVFRWWNRACEYSADRAGLLACGKPQKAISALVKLVARDVNSPAKMEMALHNIDLEDDSVSNVLAETLSTHPMIIHRIEQLRKYAASSEYRVLQARVNRAG